MIVGELATGTWTLEAYLKADNAEADIDELINDFIIDFGILVK